MKGRIAKAVLTVSVIAACEEVVDAGFDSVLPRAPDAAAAGSGLAAGGSGIDASAGAGGNAAGGTGNSGGAAGSAAGTTPTDAADSNESAERDARGDTNANSPPVAADGTLVIVEGTKKSGSLPSSDAEGDVLVHRIDTAPVLGSVRITNATTGEFEYSSRSGAYGRDAFTYQVRDPTSNALLAGTIEITVVALGPLRAEADVVQITHNGLGRSVDIEGDTAVAGAWWWGGESFGAAYVMRRDVTGAWKVSQAIVEDYPVEQYGQQVALTGDWLIVTASALYAADNRPGEAYFYKRQNKNARFAFQHKFQAPRPVESDKYGSVLAVNGDVAVIGARGNPFTVLSDGGTDIAFKGAAYVYRRNTADEWRLEKAIESPDPDGERFAWGVGVYGDTLAVSAGLKTDPAAGRIHFFVREDQQWKFKTTSTLISRPGFALGTGIVGESIAVYGDNMLVSNPNFEHEGGYAAVFTRELDGWRWRAAPIWGPEPDPLPGFGGSPVDFGYPIAMHGDTAVISAFLAQQHLGAAYVYRFLRSPDVGQWRYTGRKLVVGDVVSYEWSDFGYAVAFDGTTTVIGAPSEGQVYFFGIAPPDG